MRDTSEGPDSEKVFDLTERFLETNRLSRLAYAAMGYDVDKPMNRSAVRIGTMKEKNAFHEEFHRRVEELFGKGE